MYLYRIVLPLRLAVIILLTYAVGLSGEFVPWDSLIDNSWLEVAPPDVFMHTVNAGSYKVGFDIFRTDGGARGMNALKFAVGSENTGHHVTSSLSGSFDVENTGVNFRTFYRGLSRWSQGFQQELDFFIMYGPNTEHTFYSFPAKVA